MQKNTTVARVSSAYRGRYEVLAENGRRFARLKAAAFYNREDALFPAVGDLVRLLPNDGGDSLILETLPRRGAFVRADPWNVRPQVVAANVDLVLVTRPLDRDFSPAMLDRYLVLARESGASALVVFTKRDAPGAETELSRARDALPENVESLAVSTVTGENLPALRERLLPGQLAALLGPSGAGKSSLLNALLGEEAMATGAVRARDGRGRHTTVRRQLFVLPNGAFLMDTPGMRELGMTALSGSLGEIFPDIEALAAQCRFSDCTHTREPGCAVREAVESGALDPKRLKSYRTLRREGRGR